MDPIYREKKIIKIYDYLLNIISNNKSLLKKIIINLNNFKNKQTNATRKS